MICDFCRDESPASYSHHCEDFDAWNFGVNADGSLVDLPTTRFYGAWMACDDCHALIANRLWDALVARAVKDMTPDERGRGIEDGIRAIHEGFRASRTGKVTALIRG